MAEPFIAEIRIFAGNFAPRGWAACDGQLLPIAQHQALFSLVGTTYGGDGRVDFALPDLRGRAPMHPGRGPGLSARRLGEVGGAETVALAPAQLPAHGHPLETSTAPGEDDDPDQAVVPAAAPASIYGAPGAPAPMADDAVAPTGAGQPHQNMPPYLAVTFIIALVGLFPARG